MASVKTGIVSSVLFFFTLNVHAQEVSLALEDMSAFKPQAGNWQIVGGVLMNPDVDIHPAPAQAAAVNEKKKKSKKPAAQPEHPKAVTFTAGKGILLNFNDDTKKDNLVTAFEYGDIELELEVMLPKGSNSGIYLQGRYEVQLFDSWGVKDPRFSDIGGIYRNWESEKGKIYMGKAPLSNPAKAPGLWQTMKIVFHAPRFDGSGKKIANAKFVSVELNGVKIHDNVEVPLPTGGPIENNEKPTGPLLIQGDHGPVAFRNIKYKLTKDVKVTIGEIAYQAWQGNFKGIDDFTSQKPFKQGTSPELTCEVIDDENEYAVKYSGNVNVPDDGTYIFGIVATGGMKLVINGTTHVDLQRGDAWDYRETQPLPLKAGSYPFQIYNFKTAAWMPPRLGFGVKTPTSAIQMLHAYNSYPPDSEPTSPILIDAGSTTRLLRAFVDFKGDRKQRLTHTIGVGDPGGINYVYDLESGNLVCVWRGAFVDATPMWHDRGDGSFRPRGAAQFLFVNQPLFFLPGQQEPFPAMPKEEDFRTKGYSIDESTGRPLFRYIYKGLEVQDKIYPVDEDRSVTHEVLIKNPAQKQGLYYKLAEGSTITSMPNGAYAIDMQYYLKPANAAFIREVNGKKELVTQVENNEVRYTIIW